MKKFALILVMILFVCSGAFGQGFLKKIGKNAKDKTTDRSESTVDKAVNKAFDALDGILDGKKKDKKAKDGDDDEEDEDENPGAGKKSFAGESALWDCTNPECGHKGNTGKFCSECGAKRPAGLASSLSMFGKYTTSKIVFMPGSAELKFESFSEIQKIAEYMKSDPQARLIVQVVYVNTTPNSKEDALSEDRAENIVKALIELGCDEFSLKAVDKDYAGLSAKDKSGLKGLYSVFIKK